MVLMTIQVVLAGQEFHSHRRRDKFQLHHFQLLFLLLLLVAVVDWDTVNSWTGIRKRDSLRL